MPSALLTTAQAAARLGVKPATVYAYVSRGLLNPIREPGRRGSRFSPDDVEALRTGDRRATTHGLVIDSSITLIEDGRYWYRGHDAVDLASRQSFERIAELLWNRGAEAADWDRSRANIEAARTGWLGLPESSSVLQRLEAMALSLSASDPIAVATSPQAIVASGRTMLSALAHALPPHGHTEPDSVAGSVAVALGNEHAESAIDQALGLLADHGLAASTTSVRLAAGFGATIHQSVVAGLATLSGPLHGGASGATRRLLDEAVRTSTTLAVQHALGERALPGVGQPLYPDGDPRYVAITDALRADCPEHPVVEVIADIDRLCDERGWGHPNVDMGLGALATAYGLVAGAGEAIFAVGRMAGWIAHAAEALDAERIRPRARYVGVRPS